MAAVGFFDSGVGGVAVMKEARLLLPDEDFVFYGDNANAPYGDRDIDEIRRLTLKGTSLLLERGIKALVIACNTATSAAAAELRATLSIPVVGIEPALKPAHALLRSGVIVVLATAATLSLPKFAALMSLYGERAVPVAGRGLVELIEKGGSESEECAGLLAGMLAPYQKQGIDAIVLGCTHYVFLRGVLSRLCPGVPVVDGHRGTARQLARVLERGGIAGGGSGQTVFLSSGGDACVALMRRMYDELPVS